MPKRVLVLGARGFLGEHLVQELLAAGCDVVAAMRPGSMHAFSSPRVCVREGDFTDGAFVRTALDQADAVIFSAGRTWQPGLSIDAYHSHNVAITQTFFDALGQRPDMRVVFTSSLSAMAGSEVSRVYAEDTGREGIMEAWLSPYDRAKIACEQIAIASARRGNNVVILNPGLLLGPGAFPTSNLAAPYYLLWYCQGQFTAKFFVNGGVTLSDVRDVARAHVAALERGRTGERYIVGGHNLDRREFYARVTPMIGRRMPTALPGWLLYGLMSAADGLSFLTRGLIGSPVHRSFAFTQRLYYFGVSDKAVGELGYSIRPIEATLLDMLKDYSSRGLLPESLAYVKDATLENASAFVLLKQLAKRSGYARFLLKRLPAIFDACQANLALREALTRLLQTSTFDNRSGAFVYGPFEIDGELQTLRKFFEYVYFSSNEFLRKVV